MIAINLTAGCSRRMQRLTNDLHKTLFDERGRTIVSAETLDRSRGGRCALMLHEHAVYLKDAMTTMDGGRGWLRLADRTPLDHEALTSAWGSP